MNRTACGDGKIGTGTGKRNETEGCIACAAGKYKTNQTTCSNCGNGYYCPGGATRTACGTGKIGTGTGKKNETEGCKTCAAGTYKTSQTVCSNCGNGYYCPGGETRTACPGGTQGNGTTTASTQAAACKTCAAGGWCTGGTHRATCSSVGLCSKGNTGQSTKSGACKSCWHYVADYDGSDSCGINCPPKCGFPVCLDQPGHCTENHLDQWRCQDSKSSFDSSDYFGRYCWCNP
jgi:hypothetical protein